MSEQEGQEKAINRDPPKNDEVGPTEKLREGNKSDTERSVPGAQNPESEEIKDESNPNTE
jgi:hypothetical protein